ncbi:hypothetical protein GCK32_010316 [Trichostrongylus colubriformis]|uniref:MCM5 C-terminal domain-containing protein n=1 Tax=Trichostrongylus colubriformis TaxID=6319 RepID=A0AAN8J228_TRICO
MQRIEAQMKNVSPSGRTSQNLSSFNTSLHATTTVKLWSKRYEYFVPNLEKSGPNFVFQVILYMVRRGDLQYKMQGNMLYRVR